MDTVKPVLTERQGVQYRYQHYCFSATSAIFRTSTIVLSTKRDGGGINEYPGAIKNLPKTPKYSAKLAEKSVKTGQMFR